MKTLLLTLLRGPLAAMRFPAYRWLWASNASGAMTWNMNSVAQGWLVLTLTDSPFWLGAVAGLSGLVMAATAPVAGVLADRWERRLVLFWSGILAGGVLAVLGVLEMAGLIQVWHILVAAALSGAMAGLAIPASQAFIYDLAGREGLVNAVSLNFLSVNLARIAGPAVAGVTIEGAGIGECFLIMAAIQALGAFLVLPIRARKRERLTTGSVAQGLVEGLGLLKHNAPVRRLLVLSIVGETFAYSHIILLPAMARDVLHLGAAGFGLLSSVAGLGASAANVLLATLGNVGRKGLLLFLVCIGFGLFLVLFAASPWIAISALALAAVGFFSQGYDVLLNSLLQLSVSEELRGRMLGLYVFTWGFLPMGGFALGVVATLLSTPLALAFGGGALLLYSLSVARGLVRFQETPVPRTPP